VVGHRVVGHLVVSHLVVGHLVLPGAASLYSLYDSLYEA